MDIWVIDTRHQDPRAFAISEAGFEGIKKNVPAGTYVIAGGGVEKVKIEKKRAVEPVDEIDSKEIDKEMEEIEGAKTEKKSRKKNKGND